MSKIILNLPGKRTTLYPIVHAHVREIDRIISEKLMKWRTFSARRELEVTTFHGKSIRYSGVRYEGSPHEVFWGGFVEPFLEDGVKTTLQLVVDECAARNLKADEYLDEASALLLVLIRRSYMTMAETDQVLRGQGYPESAEPRDVSGRINTMGRFIENYRSALLHRGDEATGEILELKPSFYGIRVDLRALWRRVKAKFGSNTRVEKDTS